ncbi:MAG: TRL-like protein family [Planctomycetes bacterium]|nr:TRL-like protein family [Planctomycetota bacterium]
MFRKLMLAGALALALSTTGCLTVATPAQGAIYTEVNWTMLVTGNEVDLKSTSGTAWSIFGAVAFGDISVETLAARGGIQKVHHVDARTKNVLGVGWITVTVYGE